MGVSKISEVLLRQVEAIKAFAGGDSEKKIDTNAEYAELSKLLSTKEGTGTANQNYIRGLMVEYQVKNNFEDHAGVSDRTQKMVTNFVKSKQDKEYTITKNEAQNLVTMLRDPGLSADDRQYIIDVLNAGGYNHKGEPITQNQAEPTPNPEAGHGETTPTKPEPTTPEPVKPTPTPQPEPTPDPVKPAPTPQPEPKPVKPNPKPEPQPAPKPVKPDPKPQPKPTPQPAPKPVKPTPKETPKIMRADQLKGTQLGDNIANELNATFITSDAVIVENLGQVNKRNAYDCFKTIELKGGDKPFAKILNNCNSEPLAVAIKPLDALLTQAKSYNLEGTPAFKTLQKTVADMKGTRNIAGNDADIPDYIKNKIDAQIQALIKQLDNKVVVE